MSRFAAFFTLFAGAMLGLVVAGDVWTLFVCWELTSVLSFLLIGLDDEAPAARTAALRALLVTGAGGLVLLGGLLCLVHQAGSSELAAVIAAAPRSTMGQVGLALVVVGAFSKSAQVPLHFWLPGAMAAPTPVSAYLHSATMVKAGRDPHRPLRAGRCSARLVAAAAGGRRRDHDAARRRRRVAP